MVEPLSSQLIPCAFAKRPSGRDLVIEPSRKCTARMVEITYISDLLCVWAYISQARVNATKDKFGDAVRIEHRFCSVFGDTAGKITATWKDKGGYEGFNAHLRQAAERFPHIDVHPDIWLKVRPPSSASAHLFMKIERPSISWLRNREARWIRPKL